MGRKRILETAVAAIVAAIVSGFGAPAAAQSADGPSESQAPPPAAPGSGASGQDRPHGDFGPGGVPRKREATTQPSAAPSNAGASEQTRSGGDYGPGGVPGKRETTAQPSGRTPADGGGAPEPGK